MRLSWIPLRRPHRHRTFAAVSVMVGVLLVAFTLVSCFGDDVTEPNASPMVLVSMPSLELGGLGATAQLSADVRDGDGIAVDGEALAWTSDDPSVAQVDAAGLVTAVGNGTATIKATFGSATATVTVTVAQKAARIEVTPAVADAPVGEEFRFTAEAFDEFDHALSGVVFEWSTSDSTVAVVDDEGKVRRIGEGRATITAEAGGVRGVAAVGTSAASDRDALVALYEATDGPNWVNSENWLSDRPLGEWYGVTTDNAGRVTRIDLAGEWNSEERRYDRHGLNGELPGEIGQLANLQHLDLRINLLTGEIPAELGRLANLRSLDLQINMFTGEIPAELGQLSSLRSLGLSSNQLTGEIPPELGQLTNLRQLSLGGNQLTGEIPPALGQLPDLRRLYLWGNQLTGAIPPELGQLANLEQLLLHINQLTGQLPSELGQLTALSRMYLRHNRFFGALPYALVNLDLETLDIREAGDLCVPGTRSFVDWLAGVERLQRGCTATIKVRRSDNQGENTRSRRCERRDDNKVAWVEQVERPGEPVRRSYFVGRSEHGIKAGRYRAPPPCQRERRCGVGG